MKLPIPFLLYVASLGLAGFTGWQVYELLPLQKRESKDAAIKQGQKTAIDRLSTGRGAGPISADWRYTANNREWWKEFKNANFLGKLPPPPEPKPGEGGDEPPPPPPPVIPLEEIFELAALVYDGQDKGQGELSHVVIRYKRESGVQPPEWYVRQNQGAAAGGGFGGPRDTAPPPRPGGNPNFRGGSRNQRPPTPTPNPMPTQSSTTDVLLQKVWVKGDGDPRRDPHLWPPFDHIRLVRVDPSAQSAYFVREAPPPREGEPEPEAPKEEQLFKTSANLSQDVLRELSELYGQEISQGPASQGSGRRGNEWIETEETQLVGNVRHIGRKDERAFQNEDDFFEKVYFDTYTSKYSSRRGLKVTNVEPALAAKYGVSQGDVLLSVNNRKVKSKAQAVQFGKREYKKGVRTFVTTWLSGGQEVERVYQLPDK